ncbi:MAG: DUF3967 domain-containing protein [Bacillota bacterium]|nr:DUF3967 domain-containing protein [Bacillota bacterium]
MPRGIELSVENEEVYSSEHVAMVLKIQESTLRKYCLLLEKAGYRFFKNEHGHRGFLNKDVIALKKLKEIKSHPDMTLEQACNAVMTWVKQNDVANHDINDISEKNHHDDSYTKLLQEFEDFKEQQKDFNKELLEELKKQQEYIQKSLDERDRTLMAALRETLETKQLLLATQEKSKKWFEFWRK